MGTGGQSRRWFLVGGGAAVGLTGVAYVVRRRIQAFLSRLTRLDSFARTPALVPHDPVRDRQTLYVGRHGSPEANIDAVLHKLGGVARLVGKDDIVLIKVNAQWWNQGMTNVAAVKRLVEQILARDGFGGEVIVFENVHFRLANGSGLARAWTRPSERNVDVPGWTCLGDLVTHAPFREAPVSFVGLVDAAASQLAEDDWLDPEHLHGVYGGDERGPIDEGEARDGYLWSLDEAFEVPRSWVDSARTPLSWPVLLSPRSGLSSGG